MKTSKIIAAAALSLLAAAGAHADAYNYVPGFNNTSERSRDEVRAEATAAAHRVDPYRDGATSQVQPVLRSSVDRDAVKAQAIAAAHAPNQNLDRKAFFNSEIPASYSNGS